MISSIGLIGHYLTQSKSTRSIFNSVMGRICYGNNNTSLCACYPGYRISRGPPGTSGGYIENLPRDIVVEVPATVDAGGIHPLPVGAIPETYAAYMRTQFSIIKLVVEAYRTGSKRLLLQALLLDPCVNSITAAEKLLDEMLHLQKDFLPELA